ncbi:hypothetical protein CPB83DRAFT_852160 [Crepidotus variabilis]|uniref:Uncharacterized protein n=1 Tax=Crepidotus variabilis TaxID=179855 RepID=A0A9P6EIP0_9AGAR|nr:hypothetical protein CPB83DRAFT_852160 [Crepidotus variabilis]
MNLRIRSAQTFPNRLPGQLVQSCGLGFCLLPLGWIVGVGMSYSDGVVELEFGRRLLPDRLDRPPHVFYSTATDRGKRFKTSFYLGYPLEFFMWTVISHRTCTEHSILDPQTLPSILGLFHKKSSLPSGRPKSIGSHS